MDSQPLIEVLKRHSGDFHPVVPFDPSKEKLLLLDFTENNKEINANILDDEHQFINYINQKLKSANAKFGIGGYDELREVYSRSKLFSPHPNLPPTGEGSNTQPLFNEDAERKKEFSTSEVSEKVSPASWRGGQEGAEPRRLHLGIDIWGKPYTPVISPLNGIVHSFAFNNHFGDYGATLILTHNLEGYSFHTLYGHLSLNSIKNFQEGDTVKKGDVIAEFGIPMENGQWPPHLHFQIIIDIEDWKGDYPGVCKYSEREKYLANCPDPDLILQMIKYV